MKVAVWDTYVKNNSGKIMHFDIIVPEEIKDTSLIYKYGKEYLKSKKQEKLNISSNECKFCHFRIVNNEWLKEIEAKGYFIIEMENCCD